MTTNKSKLLKAMQALSLVPMAMVSGDLVGQSESVENAGIAGAVKQPVEGLIPGENSRVVFVGSEIFRDEVIKTGEDGTAHLMFADKSSLTIGPNSEVKIDSFVYQPESQSGELLLSASVGVLRFVGGALSKSGNVSITTPSGTLGIRGGVMVIEINAGDGETYAFFIYGDEMTGVSNISDANALLNQSEHWIRLTPSGEVVDEGEFDMDDIAGLMEGFTGDNVEVQSYVGLENVPDNYAAVIEEVDEQEDQVEQVEEEVEIVVVSS